MTIGVLEEELPGIEEELPGIEEELPGIEEELPDIEEELPVTEERILVPLLVGMLALERLLEISGLCELTDGLESRLVHPVITESVINKEMQVSFFFI